MNIHSNWFCLANHALSVAGIMRRMSAILLQRAPRHSLTTNATQASSAMIVTIGAIRFKLAWRGGRIVNAVPEFDDCARLAHDRNLSVKDVQAIAVQAYGATPRAEPRGPVVKQS